MRLPSNQAYGEAGVMEAARRGPADDFNEAWNAEGWHGTMTRDGASAEQPPS